MAETKVKKRNISLEASLYLIVIIWAIFGVQQLLHIDMAKLGIIPRQKAGLWGIFFAPFIHANLQHILYNTIPLFVLSLILALLKPRSGIWIWFLLDITTGLAVWLFARGDSVHIGASGVIFALIGFIFTYGIFRRSAGSIIAAILIAALYGSLLWGILPTKTWISWESHLFGLISGLFWGFVWGRADRKKIQALKQKEIIE